MTDNTFDTLSKSLASSNDKLNSTTENVNQKALKLNNIYNQYSKEERIAKNLKVRLKLKYINYNIIINAADIVGDNDAY